MKKLYHGVNKMGKYINDEYFYVLDIETGKASMDGDMPSVVWLCYGYLSKYNKRGKRLDTFFFREWEQLTKKLKFIDASSFTNLIFVHNLAYEGDFLIKNVAKAKNFCSNSNHHFISLELEGYKNVQFRCSYSLSGVSLRELGKMVELEKLEDEYYSYLPSDEIPQQSKEYCQRDCDIVAKYIAKVIKEYKQLSYIPYTKTGRVRKMLQDFYSKLESKETTWDLYPDEDVYDLITKAFLGGVTTSNPKYTGIVLENVHSYDKKSSYPSVMLIEKYPYIMKRKDLPTISDYRAYPHFIIEIKFYNLKSKYEWGWFPSSKCKIDVDELQAEIFNGKILWVKDEWVTTTITDIDLINIMNTYTFEKYEIISGCVSEENDKLPECYIKTLEYYSKAKYESKEEWKKNPSKENYDKMVQAKGDFNSIYGMCVQKICPETFKIDEYGIWEKTDDEYVQKKKHLKRNFIFGVYITAYARKSLLDGIINNCEGNFVYCDTDSIKFTGMNEFVDVTPELIEYKDNKSIYGLGKFEYEGTYDLFKTYGAKKYCYTVDEETEYVVAGLPKGTHLNSIDEFRLQTEFPECKLASIYICDEKEDVKVTIDGLAGEEIKVQRDKINAFKKRHNIKTNGGVALYPVGYVLDMTENDIDVIRRRYKRETV